MKKHLWYSIAQVFNRIAWHLPRCENQWACDCPSSCATVWRVTRRDKRSDENHVVYESADFNDARSVGRELFKALRRKRRAA